MVDGNKIILVGAFNTAVELAEECKKEIIGIIDNNIKVDFMGYPILGSDEDREQVFRKYPYAQLVLVPDDGERREYIYNLYKNCGFSFASLVHPAAKVSKRASLGEGVQVQSGAVIGSFARLEKLSKISFLSYVGHDSVIGQFTTVAVQSVILGQSQIGSKCYIGSNCTILPNLTIGDSTVVGAHANVTKNIGSGKTVVGNPAKELRRG